MIAHAPARAALTILLAEDDAEDREFTASALARCGVETDLRFVEDGADALDYLHHRGSFAEVGDSPRPDLMLLDLRLPLKDGFRVLEEVRADPELCRMPVVVLSTSSWWEDIDRCYDLGANSFMTKPETFGELVTVMHALGHYWSRVVALPSNTL